MNLDREYREKIINVLFILRYFFTRIKKKRQQINFNNVYLICLRYQNLRYNYISGSDKKRHIYLCSDISDGYFPTV